jgi:hypothetical protein
VAHPRKRVSVSPAELFRILDEEFARVRPNGCSTCRVPLPFRVARADAVAANWMVGRAQDCPYRCGACITAVVHRLWARYDLEEPLMSHAHDEGRRLH